MTAQKAPLATPRQAVPRLAPVGARRDLSAVHLLGLVLLHAVLGLLIRDAPGLATFHAWAAVMVALFLASRGQTATRALGAVSYVVGSEVLWRTAGARFFYEGPKYVLVAALGILYLRRLRHTRLAWLPLAYLALLVPGALLTFLHLGFASREPLSFNLSGPLSLGVAVLFFTKVTAEWRELRGLLLCVVVPLVSVAALAARGIAGLESSDFGTESNALASGGFGPNQVSVAMGFGALACLVIVLREPRAGLRLMVAVVGMWLVGQSLLTFSRGGALSAMTAGAALLLFELGRRGGRARAIVALALGVLLGSVIFAQLDSFTGGSLAARFSDTTTTGRAEIAERELTLFERNKVLGVGAGRAQELAGRTVHTEFVRLLAEHGILGGLAVGLLGLMIAMALARSRTSASAGALVVAFGTFSLVTMSHAAMRLSVVSLSFGLAMLQLRAAGAPVRGRHGAAHPGSESLPDARRT